MGTPDIRHDFSPTALADAIEANVLAFNLLPAYGPFAEIHDDPNLLWFTTGLPYPVFNGVLRARFAQGEVDRRIEDALACFRRSELPLTWCVGPSTRPLDLETRLRAHGLACTARMPGMSIDLYADRPAPRPWPGLAIERVRDLRALSGWLQPIAEGFDFTPDLASATYSLYGGLGLAPERPLQHFLGRIDGEVVSSGTLYFRDGVAGLYCIATMPQHRRRGIGTAMTLALLNEAYVRGYRLAVLYATSMGIDLYRRIGFQTHCGLTFYTWPAVDGAWDGGCGE